MRRVLRFAALMALVAVTMCLAGAGCNPVESLGDVLDKELASVQGVVASAGQEGRGTVAEAGMEAANTIQRFKSAYDDSLNKSVDKLDQKGTGKLQEITALVATPQPCTDAEIKNAGIEAQTIANTLPGSKTVPQLKRYSPMFVATGAGLASEIEIKVDGNFPSAVNADFKPSLSINGHDYENSGNSTFSLQFLVPTSVMAQSADNQIRMTRAELKVPFRSSMFLGLIKTKEVGSFMLLIGALPQSPGKMVVTVTHPTPPPTEVNVPVTEHHSWTGQGTSGLRARTQVHLCPRAVGGGRRITPIG